MHLLIDFSDISIFCQFLFHLLVHQLVFWLLTDLLIKVLVSLFDWDLIDLSLMYWLVDFCIGWCRNFLLNLFINLSIKISWIYICWLFDIFLTLGRLFMCLLVWNLLFRLLPLIGLLIAYISIFCCNSLIFQRIIYSGTYS